MWEELLGCLQSENVKILTMEFLKNEKTQIVAIKTDLCFFGIA